MLTGEDFYSRQYGIVFDTILSMAGKNVDVDVVTLINALREKNLPRCDKISVAGTLRSAC